MVWSPTDHELKLFHNRRLGNPRRNAGGLGGGGRGAGGGLAFFPTQLGGALAGWNFELANVTKDGSNRLSQVNDLSGGTAHLVQATGADQPLWVDAVLNERPVARFAAANTEFMLATHAGDKAQPNTIYCISKANNTAATKSVIDSDTAGKRHLLQYDNTEVPSIFAGSVLAAGAADTNWLAWIGDFNGATSNVYRDDFTTPVASGTANTNVLGPGFSLGRSSADANYFDGDIAEIWVFAGSHTQAQRNLMRDYFNARYALGIV